MGLTHHHIPLPYPTRRPPLSLLLSSRGLAAPAGDGWCRPSALTAKLLSSHVPALLSISGLPGRPLTSSAHRAYLAVLRSHARGRSAASCGCCSHAAGPAAAAASISRPVRWWPTTLPPCPCSTWPAAGTSALLRPPRHPWCPRSWSTTPSPALMCSRPIPGGGDGSTCCRWHRGCKGTRAV